MIYLSIIFFYLLVLLDKLYNNFRATAFFIDIWRALIVILRRMGTWRGIFSLSIVWLLLSGIGLAIIGLILNIKTLWIAGLTLFGIWAGPATPLMPIVIAFAMIFQRYVLRDKTVSMTEAKEIFKESRRKH